jgi:DNA invertase Pin-like site-specific DNA recombinase
MPAFRPTGRPSTARLRQLRAAGCGSRNIYHEKVTGAHSDRRQLLRIPDRLTPGDVVTVTRIGRLARSTQKCAVRYFWPSRNMSLH